MLNKLKDFFFSFVKCLGSLFTSESFRKMVVPVGISIFISSVLAYTVLIPAFISRNGESIIKAVETMYKKKEEENKKEGMKNVDTVYSDIISDGQLPFIGNRYGSKIVIEFFDYACGHCKHQASELKNLVAMDRDVKVILVDFPILSQGSFVVSSIGVYIYNKYPEKFQSFYDFIISSPQIDQKVIEAGLAKIGLNKAVIADAMQKDLVSRDVLQRNHKRASLLKLNGTPALVVKGKLIPGAVQAQEIIKLF